MMGIWHHLNTSTCWINTRVSSLHLQGIFLFSSSVVCVLVLLLHVLHITVAGVDFDPAALFLLQEVLITCKKYIKKLNYKWKPGESTGLITCLHPEGFCFFHEETGGALEASALPSLSDDHHQSLRFTRTKNIFYSSMSDSPAPRRRT